MKEIGLKCKIENYLFGQTKMEYLGFWVINNDAKPMNKNIEAITNMKRPTSPK